MTRPPVELVIVIDAPPELVWEALTEADRLVGWLAAEAKTTPGEGGSIWLSWGPDYQGSSRIDVWEPGRRLRLVDEMPEPAVLEYVLDAREGRTLLRLVHSGFGRSTWDDEYDSLNRGWRVFLQALRHGLERHASVRWHGRTRIATADRPVEDIWGELFGGLGAPDALTGAREGDRLHLAALPGDGPNATMLLADPPWVACLALEPLADGLLAVFLEPAGDTCAATLMRFLYGEDGGSPAAHAAIDRAFDRTFQQEVADGRL